MDCLRQAIRLNPDYVPAYLELADLLLKQDDLKAAVEIYRQAVTREPADGSLRSKLDELLCKQESVGSAGNESAKPSSERARKEPGRGRHLLFYTDCPGINGVAQCNQLVTRGLRQAGYKITYAQAKASHHLIAERIEAGIAHIWLQPDDLYDRTTTPRALKDSAEAERVFSATQPDLVIFSGGAPFSNLKAKEIAVRLQIPFVVVVHCVAVEWCEQFAPYLDRLSEVFRHAEAVVAVSKNNLELMHRVFRLPTDKGQVIHNGRPAKFFAPCDAHTRTRVRQDLGIPHDGVLALTVARLGIVKGYQYQLKAMAQLKESRIWPQLWFIWVGGGNYESRLRAVASELGLANKVRFLGVRTDIPQILDAADMFILPSQFEGMPLSIMEAMAKGLPVMATAVSGIPEALAETGKLLTSPEIDPQRTISELRTTIETWTGDAKLRSCLGQAGKKRAETMFRAGRMVSQYIMVIEKCFRVSAA